MSFVERPHVAINSLGQPFIVPLLSEEPSAFVKPAFVRACAANTWSPRTVRGWKTGRSVTQDEILYQDVPDDIRRKIAEAFVKSGNGDRNSIEVGFFVAVLPDRNICSDLITSNSFNSIKEDATRKGLADLHSRLRYVDRDAILRTQFYHTHPKGGPAYTTVSEGDVDAALVEQFLFKQRGLDKPHDMHAMPHETKGVIMRVTVP